MNRFALCLAGIVFSATSVLAAEQGVIHCFTFTPVKTATDADWQAFWKATEGLPKKIKGLQHVVAGKLNRPQTLTMMGGDAEARKKVMAEGKGTAEVRVVRREYGVCMHFADMAAFKAYDPDPAHKEWNTAYEKVREPGTTTFQIIGQ